jgi:hypothetical protein
LPHRYSAHAPRRCRIVGKLTDLQRQHRDAIAASMQELPTVPLSPQAPAAVPVVQPAAQPAAAAPAVPPEPKSMIRMPEKC